MSSPSSSARVDSSIAWRPTLVLALHVAMGLVGCVDSPPPDTTTRERVTQAEVAGARGAITEDTCAIWTPPPSSSPSPSPSSSASPSPPAAPPPFVWPLYVDGDAIPRDGSALVSLGSADAVHQRALLIANPTNAQGTVTITTSASFRVVDLANLSGTAAPSTRITATASPGNGLVLRVSLAPSVTGPMRGTLRINAGGANGCIALETTAPTQSRPALALEFVGVTLGQRTAPLFLGTSALGTAPPATFTLRNDSTDTLVLDVATPPTGSLTTTTAPATLAPGQRTDWSFTLPRQRPGLWTDVVKVSYFVGATAPADPELVRPRAEVRVPVSWNVLPASSAVGYELRVDGALMPLTNTVPLSFAAGTTRRVLTVKNTSAAETLRVRLTGRSPLVVSGSFTAGLASFTPIPSVFTVQAGQTFQATLSLEEPQRLAFPFTSSVDVRVYQ